MAMSICTLKFKLEVKLSHGFSW